MRYALIGLGMLLAAPAAAQAPDRDMQLALERARKAIALVHAADCPSGAMNGGTGFVWQRPDRMVTALHVVAGCRTIAVQFPGSAQRPARLINAMRAADLALLAIEPRAGAEALRHTTRVPEPTEVVHVYGYAAMIQTPGNFALAVQDNNRVAFRLEQALNAETLRKLDGEVPSLSIEVLRTDGNLQPGLSGAPVIDRSGAVVAIGSGGVDAGTGGIGWSIRARYLEQLPASTDPPTLGRARASGARFSAELVRGRPNSGNAGIPTFRPPPTLRCGWVDFVRTRTRTLGELAATSDDQAGLRVMMDWMNVPLSDLDDMAFDIWTDPQTGAGIALPVGARPHPDGDVCIAEFWDGMLKLVFGGDRGPPGLVDDPQWQDEQFRRWRNFETTVHRMYGNLAPDRDPSQSYGRWQDEFGMLVYRGLDRDDRTGIRITKTLASRHETFVGMLLLDDVNAGERPYELRRLVAASRLAVHLASFPPYR